MIWEKLVLKNNNELFLKLAHNFLISIYRFVKDGTLFLFILVSLRRYMKVIVKLYHC